MSFNITLECNARIVVIQKEMNEDRVGVEKSEIKVALQVISEGKADLIFT